jgi:hypothetical protein
MALCPLFLTAKINGIYYYYCLDCSVTPPSATGAQDTREHKTGVNCSNILDPMLKIIPSPDTSTIQAVRAPTGATATVVGDVPVSNSDPTGSGIAVGSAFDAHFDDHKIALAPLGVVLEHHKNKKFKAKFKLSDGSERSVRLFSIRVSWVTDTGQKTDILRVGQELADPTPDPPGSDALKEYAEDVATDSRVKFVKITLKDTGGVYYVLLK